MRPLNGGRQGTATIRSTLVGFADDTTVQPDGDYRYTAKVKPGWEIAGNTNGGYLLSIAVRAMLMATERPDPVTVTGHFLSPGRPGAAHITTEVVKRGRTLTTATAAVVEAGGKRLLQVLGAFGDVSTPSGPERVETAPPDLPPPEACVAVEPSEPFPPPFMGRVDLRLHPDDAGFATGAPAASPACAAGSGCATAN